ncbi:MAG: glycosyltransferase family 2 protein [Bacteroidales bacterium]|nr:glycosyltransferase family 2 protein [Bacteroidales bacterium]
MNKAIKISVILPVYNGMEYLEESVNSVLNQDMDDYEFLICDDRSSDKSFEFLSKYKNNKIQLFKSDRNKGLFPTLNFLIKKAKSPLIHLWAQDDIMLPFCLSEAVNFFETNPKISFMFSRLQNIDKNNNIINTPHTFKDRVISTHEHAVRSISYGSMPGNISNVVLNKKYVEKVGFFNETMIYAGDFDLWCRLSKVAQVGELGKILTRIRTHKGQLSRNINVALYKLKENYTVYECFLSVFDDDYKKRAKKVLKWRHYYIYFNQFLTLLFTRKFQLSRKYFSILVKYDNFFLLFFRWFVVRILMLFKKEHQFYAKIRKGFIDEYLYHE